MGQLRLRTRWLSAIRRAGVNMETLHALHAPQQPQATMPVGSRLSQQPVRPSTSTESTRKRKGTDSVPRTSKHTHADPIPCRHRYGHLSLRLPIHPCLSAVRVLVLSTCLLAECHTAVLCRSHNDGADAHAADRGTVDACSRRKYLCCASYSLSMRTCAWTHLHARARGKSST